METIEAYQKFKTANPIKKEKWQPDALIVVPKSADQLIVDITNTFHSRRIKSPDDGAGVLAINNGNTLILPPGFERQIVQLNDPANRMGKASNNREIFQDLSQRFLKRGTLAESFFKFIDVCKDQNVDYAAIAGACTYYYWGGWPIYDIDVVVPNSEHLQRLINVYGGEIQESESGIGRMKYLNLGDIDALTDLELKYTVGSTIHRREFSYDELIGEGKQQRLFGENINLADPISTVALKLYLGRFGVDPWGIPKDDYEDALGTMVDQRIAWDALEAKGHQMGILDRIHLGKKIYSELY